MVYPVATSNLVVSIVIPTYKRADVFERSVETRSYWDIKLHMVDHGSFDDTTAVVGGFDDHRATLMYPGRTEEFPLLGTPDMGTDRTSEE